VSDWAIRFEPAIPGLILVALAVGMGFAFAWSYRATASETGKRLSRVLLALRIAALALIVIALLGPTLRKYVWAGERGVIALLLDDSESLSIPDAGSDDDESLTRVEALKRIVGGRRGLAKRLSRTAAVRMYAFGRELREIKSLDELASREGATDIAGALAALPSSVAGTSSADGEGAAGGRLVAAVVVSDGADTEGGDVRGAIARLAAAGVPVYAVALGGTEFRDVDVTDVRASRIVRKDTLVSVNARIRSRGFDAGKTVARLVQTSAGADASPDDAGEGASANAAGRVIAEKPVDLAAGAATVEFEFLPAEAGFLEYAVEVPVQPGEAVEKNNRREFALTVARRKVRVLYMEGSEYRRADRRLWEHQFLEEALQEDGDVEVTSLLRGKEDGAAREAGIYTVKDPDHGYPRTKKGLFEYDVIISSDIDIDFFTKEQLENTVEFVGKRGGGFVMIGGWTAFGAGGYDESVVDRMLPVDMMGRKKEGFKENENIQLAVTEEGLRHPIMQIDEDPERNRSIWKYCPPFRGHNQVQRAKPAATVLALHDTERTLYGNTVIIAVQQYGRGRSMAFTTDTTAGWGTLFEEEFGTGGDNSYYRKFWQNAVRWLAEYRLNAPSKLVSLELPGALLGRGDAQRARVTVLDEEYEPASGAKVRMTVTGPGGKERTTSLAADPATPGAYATEITFDELGRHEVEVTASLAGDPLGSDKLGVSVRPSAKEFARPEADVATLRRIAERTGGKLYSPEDADRLPEDVGDVLASVRRHKDSPLWHSWWVWGALAVVLCVEWLVRKRVGLP
jgi:uncharacterized membrane protein